MLYQMMPIRKYYLLLCLLSLVISSQAQILISNEAELRKIDIHPKGHYKLTKDIVLNHQWTPIGLNAAFEGIFDGNGRTISNVHINDSCHRHIGFFARTKNAVIKNLGIENAEVVAQSTENEINAGILIGEAISTKIINSYIHKGF